MKKKKFQNVLQKYEDPPKTVFKSALTVRISRPIMWRVIVGCSLGVSACRLRYRFYCIKKTERDVRLSWWECVPWGEKSVLIFQKINFLQIFSINLTYYLKKIHFHVHKNHWKWKSLFREHYQTRFNGVKFSKCSHRKIFCV